MDPNLLIASFIGAVVKSILKAVVGDGFAGELLSESSADLLKAHTSGFIADRGTRTQISKLGAQVAKNTVEVFSRDGIHLKANQRAAVVRELTTTLLEASVSLDSLVAFDLNPDLLSQHLLVVRPGATRHFSEAETESYERMLESISRSLITVASQLGGFERSVAAGTLQDLGTILGALDRLLHQPNERARAFERKYRDEVVRKLDRMEMLGIRRVDEQLRSQSLSISYIALEVEKRGAGIGNQGASEESAEKGSRDFSEAVEQNRAVNSLVVDAVLAGSRRIVVRGEAGSGKTTLLQWLAVRAGSQDFAGQMVGWNGAVPFFIRLREQVGVEFPKPEAFPSLIAPMLAGNMPEGWVHELLESGRAVLLVDGVDELPQLQRNAMLEHLVELVNTYPLVRYVITSRPYAVNADFWSEWQDMVSRERFSEVTLQPMDIEQVHSLIDKWHRAVAERTSDPEDIAELSALPMNLKRLLRQRPALRKLATSPLLCAMICALHRERRQRLPSERIRLYEECCDMLLIQRDDARRVPLLEDYPDLAESQKFVLVRSFAYWLMQNGWSDVETDAADQYLATRLQMMSLPPGVTAAGVRKLFVERTSLLREPVVGRIDFRHRTFQEFLAAQAAIREGDIGVLVKNAVDDQWREMIVLAAGLAGPKDCERLITGLLNRGAKLKRRRNQVHLLALACLETVIELDAKVRSSVLSHAEALFPPKHMDDAPIFAVAGDPAIPLLMSDSEQSDEVAAASVRTLALIGTDAALTGIESYKDSVRPSVTTELGRAWAMFDSIDYAKRVLSHRRSLLLRPFVSFEGVAHLTRLETLHISGGASVDDLVCLADVPSLRTLYLFDLNNAKDLRAISSLQQLQTLSIWGGTSDIKDIAPVGDLNQLRVLTLGGFHKLLDISPISALHELESISLLWCPHVRDLRPVGGLKHLRRLKLSAIALVKGLSNLANLPFIEEIEFDGCGGVHLEDLEAGERLRRLSLRSMATITDLTPLSTLTNLEYIGLYQCATVRDITPLLGLPNLKHVDISGTPIDDLSAFGGRPDVRVEVTKQDD